MSPRSARRRCSQLARPVVQAEAAGSGLNQNHHRDYDPSLGRYIQVDPLGIDAGQNPYAYVDGKPYDTIDPLGLDIVVYRTGSCPMLFPEPACEPVEIAPIDRRTVRRLPLDMSFVRKDVEFGGDARFHKGRVGF